MQILLTGSSGFLGKNIFAYFEKSTFRIQPIKARYEQIDDLDFNGNFDAIIHSAGIAHDINAQFENDDYAKANTQLSIALINKFLASEVKDFIFISSVKAIADTSNELLTEQSKRTPSTPYGISKLKVEEYIASLALPIEKRIFILQPTIMYGMGCKGNLASLVKFIKNKFPYPFASFKNERSYLNVKNLSYAIEQLLIRSDIKGGRFIVADDGAMSTLDLMELMAKEMGMPLSKLNFPKSFINFLARLGSILRLPFNQKKVAKITEDYVVSNQKLKSALSIERMPYTMSQGIKDMIDTLPKN